MTEQSSSPDSSLTGATLADLAELKAHRSPEDVAIFLEQEPPIRFGSIFSEAMRLARAMTSLGLGRGDVLSFQLPNWRESVAIDIAAAWLGMIVNPVIPIYRDRELSYILADAQTRIIFIPAHYRGIDYPGMLQRLQGDLPRLEFIVEVRATAPRGDNLYYDEMTAGEAGQPARAAVDPADTKLVLYTSGTTGNPKAVRHSHLSLAHAISNGVDGWGLRRGDIMLMPSPVTHVTGYANGIELPFFSEAQAAFMERWDVNRAMEYIQRIGATACVSATPFLQELVATAESAGVGLPTLRMFACGGASVPPALVYRTHKVLASCRAFRVYGCTEAPLVSVGFLAPEQEDLAAQTDGRIHNWDVKIIDERGLELTGGQDGEVIVRGPAMMQGYGSPEQTAEAIDGDGYFHTGDIGHVTAEGAIVISDRKKDIIIRGGENLSAREIEDVLYQHEKIWEVAVVVMPHERLGEGVCACLVLRQGESLTLEELKPFLDSMRLAKQKWPERIELREELPKTSSGKIRKDVLRREIKSLVAG